MAFSSISLAVEIVLKVTHFVHMRILNALSLCYSHIGKLHKSQSNYLLDVKMIAEIK